MKLIYVFFIFAIFLISGCASSTRGADQRVLVSTPGAPGASCSLFAEGQNTLLIKTPEAIRLPRVSGQVEVRCHKKCFQSEVKIFKPSINDINLNNNLLNDVEFLSVNLVTQQTYNYNFDFIIPMKSNGRCKNNRKGFLDGDPKDFHNKINDFSFDQDISKPSNSLPDVISKEINSVPFTKEISRP